MSRSPLTRDSFKFSRSPKEPEKIGPVMSASNVKDIAAFETLIDAGFKIARGKEETEFEVLKQAATEAFLVPSQSAVKTYLKARREADGRFGQPDDYCAPEAIRQLGKAIAREAPQR